MSLSLTGEEFEIRDVVSVKTAITRLLWTDNDMLAQECDPDFVWFDSIF